MIHRISSNLTLFYKFFIPTFILTLFGAVTLAALILKNVSIPTKLTITVVYILVLLIMAFTLLRLKRVELDEDFVYVTNYFRHFRYPHHNIEKIIEKDYRLFRTATIYFVKSGTFGKTATFLPSGSLYNDFWNTHPELRVEWLRKP